MLIAALLLLAGLDQSSGEELRATPRGEKVSMTPAGMFRLAEMALAKGEPATAEAIYLAMEQDRDGEVRAEARYRLAHLFIGAHRQREAALLLRRILDEKPNAARVRLELANILAGMGDRDAALRELRAVQSSGLPPAVARLVDRFSQALRGQRSSGASFEIALAPNSNINRATRSNTLGTLLGDFKIDESGKARSGTGLALRGQIYRRLDFANREAGILIKVSGFADLYRQREFNDVALDVSAGPELRLGRSQVNLELGATQRWYGQKPLIRTFNAVATVSRPLGIRSQLRVSGSVSAVDHQLNDLQDGRTYSGRIGIEHALSPQSGIGLNLSVNREALSDPAYSTSAWRAGVVAWREMGRLTFTSQADFGRLHADDRLALLPARRSDRFLSLSISTTFRQLQVRGFAPLARLTIEQNRSSVEYYAYRRTRAELGIVRAF